MRILVFVFLCVFTLPQLASAQKFAYVDSEYILTKIPDYKKAQETLNKVAQDWKTEIDEKYAIIEKKYNTYVAEQFLLDDDTKLRRQQEIEKLEQEAKALQNKRFGVNGELFTRKEELVKPIQDKVFEAISQTAKSKGLDVIFDKSAAAAYMLYVNSSLDLSDEIVKKMGY